MKTRGGGWTVIQHRRNGSVDFHRGWRDYKLVGSPDDGVTFSTGLMDQYCRTGQEVSIIFHGWFDTER